MEWTADQYFRKIGNESTCRAAPAGSNRLSLLGSKSRLEEKECSRIIHEKEDVQENFTATYWG
ncbi:MAG: hypothetical protein ACYDAA_06695 [Syntrophales bacterium]